MSEPQDLAVLSKHDDKALPRVVIVTEHWGEDGDESTVTTRLVAGALARHASVQVIHLLAHRPARPPIIDSVFQVHEVALKGARPLRASIMRAAIAQGAPMRRTPPPVAQHLSQLQGHAGSVGLLLDELEPDAIVLAGYRQSFDLESLGRHGEPGRARVVFLPLCEELAELFEPNTARLIDASDAIGAANPGEQLALISAFASREHDIFSLNLALNVNRSATAQGLFGVRFFGRYVLLLRSFPPGGPRYTNTITHELLRSILGKVSVAEVDGDKWRIADDENTLELPVNPTRVNLWRLMAHALFTVDLRPQGPLGRETLESMLFGTPVIVPEGSSAAAHAEAGSGGLWYRDAGELLDSSRALMDDQLRQVLSVQARSYANFTHGRMAHFVEEITAIVLNGQHA